MRDCRRQLSSNGWRHRTLPQDRLRQLKAFLANGARPTTADRMTHASHFSVCVWPVANCAATFGVSRVHVFSSVRPSLFDALKCAKVASPAHIRFHPSQALGTPKPLSIRAAIMPPKYDAFPYGADGRQKNSDLLQLGVSGEHPPAYSPSQSDGGTDHTPQEHKRLLPITFHQTRAQRYRTLAFAVGILLGSLVVILAVKFGTSRKHQDASKQHS